MKKHLILASAAIAAVAAAVPAQADTVNFDQSLDTASYTQQGLVLTNFTITNNDFGGAVIVPSTPNYASANPGPSSLISFVQPGTNVAATSNGFGLTIAGLNAGGGFFSGATLTFLGLGGATIGTQSFAPIGPQEFRSPFTYANTFNNIAAVRFERNENTAGSGLFPIDNVTFNLNPAAAAVPEPATWAFMILGFGAIGGAMRRRRGQVSMTVRYA